ncbi:MAG: collagen-binding domain-containing protein, partial [Opitutaceae bacterium]
LWKYTPGATILTGVIPAPPPSTPDLLRVSRSPYIPGLAPKLVTGGLTLTFSQGIDNHVGTPGALAPTVYQASASLDFTDPLTRLTVDGPVVINVAGDITLGTPSGAKIIVGPMGSAEIHFSGTFSCVDLTGGGIENQSFNPLKLVFIGTGTGVNTFNCTTDFYGAIYTPNADITWSGGNLYGALSAKNITLNGGWVHYDVALRKLSVGGVDSVYVISKWREITSPTDPDRVPGW